MLRYYITNRLAFSEGVEGLLSAIKGAARAGVDMIQIREKDLSTYDLFTLVQSALEMVAGTSTRVLVNDRADVALAAGAHGAHLRSDAISPREWRRVLRDGFLLGTSCHTIQDVQAAEGADFLVFGPVFDTPGKGPALGLEALQQAASRSIVPVLALGGVTEANASECIAHGAAGIAGIRLFQNLRPA